MNATAPSFLAQIQAAETKVAARAIYAELVWAAMGADADPKACQAIPAVNAAIVERWGTDTLKATQISALKRIEDRLGINGRFSLREA